MKAIFYLSTCNTCVRILKEWQAPTVFEMRNVKDKPLNADELRYLRERTSSFESLFNRRSQQYRAQGWHEKDMKESDYEALLLSHYSFLKRPLLVDGDLLFIGNPKKVVAAAKAHLKENY